MKLYAIEVNEKTIPYIEEHSNVAPYRLDVFRTLFDTKQIFLIATKPAGIYEMLCYIEGDAFFDEFQLSKDIIIESHFTEVTEL